MKEIKLSLCVNVWGKNFIDMFCDICLESMMSPGNLLMHDNDVSMKLRIYTDVDDINYLESKKIINKLRDILKIEYVEIGRITGGLSAKYNKMSLCQSDSIEYSRSIDSFVVFFHPDWVFADGVIQNIVKAIRIGRKSCYIVIPVLNMETFCEGIQDIKMSSEKLVEYSMKHFHQVSMACFFHKIEKIATSHIYYPLENEGFAAKAYHVYPLMVSPDSFGPWHDTDKTIDSFIPRKLYREHFYMPDDGNKFCIFELSPANTKLNPGYTGEEAGMFKKVMISRFFADKFSEATGRKCFYKNIVYFYTDKGRKNSENFLKAGQTLRYFAFRVRFSQFLIWAYKSSIKSFFHICYQERRFLTLFLNSVIGGRPVVFYGNGSRLKRFLAESELVGIRPKVLFVIDDFNKEGSDYNVYDAEDDGIFDNIPEEALTIISMIRKEHYNKAYNVIRDKGYFSPFVQFIFNRVLQRVERRLCIYEKVHGFPKD